MKKLWKIVVPIAIIVIVIGGVLVIKNKGKMPEKTDKMVEETKDPKDVKDQTSEEMTDEDGTVHTGTSEIVDEKDLPRWTKCEISLGGADFKLPISYKDFVKKTGYANPSELNDRQIESTQSMSFYALKDGMDVNITIENQNSDQQKLEDCTVVGLSVTTMLEDYPAPTDLVFPEDIKIGDSDDVITEKLGNPFDATGSVDGSHVSKLWSINNLYQLSITFENGNAVSLTLSTDAE